MGRHAKYTEYELEQFADSVVAFLREGKMIQLALNETGSWPNWDELENKFDFGMPQRAAIRRYAEQKNAPLMIDAGGIRIAGSDAVKAVAIKRRLKDNGTRAKNLGKEVNAKGRENVKRLVLELEKTAEGNLLLSTLPKLLEAFDQTAELASEVRRLLPARTGEVAS